MKDRAVVERSDGSVLLRNASYRAVSGVMAGPARRLRTARTWYRDRSWVAAWVFAGMTQAPALLAVAWLLPGTGMLLAGRLLPVPMLIIFVPLALALCYFAMRQVPLSWPRFAPGRAVSAAEAATPESAPVPALAGRPAVPAWSVLLTLAVSAGFSVWQVLERSQQAIVATGAGEYLQYGYWIAHHGTAKIPLLPYDFGLPSSASSAIASAGLSFTSPGFLAHGAVLSPAFMAGLPLVIAAGIWAHGVSGAFLVGPALGGLAVLSFAGLAGRLAGPRWAPAAALVLAVLLPEQYVSRTTLSEPLVQILLFGGLCLVLDSLAVRRHRKSSATPALADAPLGPDDYPDGPPSLDDLAGADSLAGISDTDSDILDSARGSIAAETSPDVKVIPIGLPARSEGPVTQTLEAVPAPEPARAIPWQAMTLAGFGGLALGLTILADIGSLNILLPVFPFLAIMFVARRPQAGPMAAGVLIGIGLSVVAGTELARPYLSSLEPQLHDMGIAVAAFGVVTALIAPPAIPAVRAWARRVLDWRLPLLGLSGKTLRVPLLQFVLEGLAVLIPLAALVGLAVRPSVQVTRGATDPYYIHYIAALQRLAKLAVDGRQQYSEQTFNWVIWYLGVPAVLLACGGAALLGRRCVRALLQWRGASAAARSWGLPLLMFGWSIAAVLWDPAIYPDQPWASRRLVPVVLPGLICLALWACSRVRQRAAELEAGRIAQALVATCSVVALVAPAAVTTFDPGYVGTGKARHVAARGMALTVTFKGEKPAVSGLCTAINGGSSAGSSSASVLIVDSPTANAFTQVVRGICDVPTARMDGASPSLIQQAVAAIERAGRRPVLLGSTSGAVALDGLVPRQVLTLSTTQDAQDLNGPPSAPWPLTYTVWLASPAGG
ncbi:MAG TPA: hypothetical protein VMU95_15570 [Trebonia sp.]|nr:hypothetical protein [Trebonia sp.]